jgi:hypothetical protein
MFLFSKRCHDCPKNKIPHSVTSQTNIDRIKAFHVDMDVFHKEKKLIIFWDFFWNTYSCLED